MLKCLRNLRGLRIRGYQASAVKPSPKHRLGTNLSDAVDQDSGPAQKADVIRMIAEDSLRIDRYTRRWRSERRSIY
jgi:hypothetical protein